MRELSSGAENRAQKVSTATQFMSRCYKSFFRQSRGAITQAGSLKSSNGDLHPLEFRIDAVIYFGKVGSPFEANVWTKVLDRKKLYAILSNSSHRTVVEIAFLLNECFDFKSIGHILAIEPNRAAHLFREFRETILAESNALVPPGKFERSQQVGAIDFSTFFAGVPDLPAAFDTGHSHFRDAALKRLIQIPEELLSRSVPTSAEAQGERIIQLEREYRNRSNIYRYQHLHTRAGAQGEIGRKLSVRSDHEDGLFEAGKQDSTTSVSDQVGKQAAEASDSAGSTSRSPHRDTERAQSAKSPDENRLEGAIPAATAAKHRLISSGAVFDLIAPDSPIVPVRVDLSYGSNDPLAITAAFSAGDGTTVNWTFARDILLQGLTEPAGAGDVRLMPLPNTEQVQLELFSPSGHAVFSTSAAKLAEFLSRCYEAVPPGEEYSGVDVDAAIAALLKD